MNRSKGKERKIIQPTKVKRGPSSGSIFILWMWRKPLGVCIADSPPFIQKMNNLVSTLRERQETANDMKTWSELVDDVCFSGDKQAAAEGEEYSLSW